MISLRLKRVAFRDTYTIGKLYVDGEYFSDTLEDYSRDFNKDGDLNDKGETKVFGETAIPYGTFKVIMNMSNRFKKVMPLVLDVPHFAGIRIHAGTKPEHSHGCILVGKNTIKGQLTESTFYTNKLYAILNKSKEIIITIE